MKKIHSQGDIRPHYDFDYDTMKPNRFAGEKKVHKQTFVVIDEDVSKSLSVIRRGECHASIGDPSHAQRNQQHARRSNGPRKPQIQIQGCKPYQLTDGDRASVEG
jgi:hypothetical protein